MSKEERTLKIGILGCGPIAQSAHLECSRKGCNTDLYAVCDRAVDLADKIAAIHHPQKTYYDYDEMLADPQVEAVIVATADQYHVPMAKKALLAGKHVFVEKPLGVTVEEVLDLHDVVKQTGLTLQVGNNKRFDPAVTFARRFIQEELGQIMGMRAWYRDSQFRYLMTDNTQPFILSSEQSIHPQGNPKANRRHYFLLAHASHLVDTARFLAGDIVSLKADLVERFGAYGWFITAHFANGCIGQMDLIVPVKGDWAEGFEVFGENGNVNGKLFMPWYKKGGEVECFSVKDGTYRKPLAEDGYSYRRQLEGFADSILKGIPQMGANVADGLANMRALAAITRSVDTGQQIELSGITGAV